MVVPKKQLQYSFKILLMVDAIEFTSHGALFHFNNNNFKNYLQSKLHNVSVGWNHFFRYR